MRLLNVQIPVLQKVLCRWISEWKQGFVNPAK